MKFTTILFASLAAALALAPPTKLLAQQDTISQAPASFFCPALTEAECKVSIGLEFPRITFLSCRFSIATSSCSGKANWSASWAAKLSS